MASAFALRFFVVSSALGLFGAAISCSAQTRSSSGDFGGGSSENTTGSLSGSGASSGTLSGSGPGTTSSDGVGTGFSTVASGTGSQGAGGGCAGTAVKAMEIPLDIFIMLDQSGSMSDTVNGGGTKWSAVTSAIGSFVTDPASAGISAGIQYFGLSPSNPAQCNNIFCSTDADCGDPSCGPCDQGFCDGYGAGVGADSCNAADYDTAAVQISPLPANGQAIINSMGQHMPTTGTPTAPALQGALEFAKNWEMQNPSHVTVVAFATDGDPEECSPQDIPSIAQIAQQYASGTPSIKTFVIGVGPDASNLDAIAQGGGTMMAYLVDTNGNAEMEFLAAMNAIRGTALQCTYSIPAAPMGQTLDYGEVNVEYTPGSGGMTQTIGNVADKSACGSSGGWYYDNPSAPTQIIMCDATCQELQMDSKGQVNIVLGCKTVVN